MSGILSSHGELLLVAVPHGGKLHLYEQSATAPDVWRHRTTDRAAHDFTRVAVSPRVDSSSPLLNVLTRSAPDGDVVQWVGVLGATSGSGPDWTSPTTRPGLRHAELALPPTVPVQQPRPGALDRFELVEGELRVWLGERGPFGGHSYSEFLDARGGHPRLRLPGTLGLACAEVGFPQSEVFCHAVTCEGAGLSHYGLAFDGASTPPGARKWFPVIDPFEPPETASPLFAHNLPEGSWGVPVLVHDPSQGMRTLIAPWTSHRPRHPREDLEVRLVRFTQRDSGSVRFEPRPSVRYPLGVPTPDPWVTAPTVLGVRVDTPHIGAVLRRGLVEVVTWRPSSSATDPLAPSECLRRWIIDGDVWRRQPISDT